MFNPHLQEEKITYQKEKEDYFPYFHQFYILGICSY